MQEDILHSKNVKLDKVLLNSRTYAELSHLTQNWFKYNYPKHVVEPLLN